MDALSARINSLPVSATLAMAAKARELKNEGIDVVLVQAPVSSFEYSKFDNHSRFDSTMSSYTRYYNFNTILNLDDSLHFYDSHHLNQKGVEIFNNTLIELLVY